MGVMEILQQNAVIIMIICAAFILGWIYMNYESMADGEYLPGTTPGGAPNMSTGLSWKGKPIGYGDFLGPASSGRTVVYDQSKFGSYDTLKNMAKTDKSGVITFEGMYDCGCGCKGSKSAATAAETMSSIVRSVTDKAPFTAMSVSDKAPFTAKSVESREPMSTRMLALTSTDPARRNLQMGFDKSNPNRAGDASGATGYPGEQREYGNSPQNKSFMAAFTQSVSNIADSVVAAVAPAAAAPVPKDSFGSAPGDNLAMTAVIGRDAQVAALMGTNAARSALSQAEFGSTRYAGFDKVVDTAGYAGALIANPEVAKVVSPAITSNPGDAARINSHQDSKAVDANVHTFGVDKKDATGPGRESYANMSKMLRDVTFSVSGDKYMGGR